MKKALNLMVYLLVINVAYGQNIDKEIARGEEGDKMLRSEIGLYEHSSKSELNSIGGSLVAKLDQRLFDYQFNILDMDVPNALALPGGYVYFSRGIMVLANSEDELAGVMGHEITHVHKQHSRKAQTRGIFTGILKIPGAIVGAFAPNAGSLLIAPFELFDSGYSRSNEKEADKEGVKLSADAGYDPNGVPLLLDKISKDLVIETGQAEKATLFDSHPYTPERVEDLDKLIDKIDYTAANTSDAEHAAFIKKMEGLCIGDNPRNGVFKDDQFLHPDLGFAFSYPTGWQTVNTPSMVGFVSEDNNAQLLFSLADSAVDPAVYSEKFVKLLAQKRYPQPTRNERLDINGHPAQIVQLELQKDNVIYVLSYLWLTRDDRCYEFAQASTANFSGIVEKTAKSLHTLSENERNSITQTIVKVVQANEGENLVQLSERTGNVLDLPYLALINNLSEEEKLSSSRWVKIGVDIKY